MDERVIFECKAQLNPNALSYKAKTLVFTDTRFYVKEEPEMSIAYEDITSVENKRWWIANYRVTIDYNSPEGQKQLKLTGASGVMPDNYNSLLIHEFLQKAKGKGLVDITPADLEVKRNIGLSGKIETEEDALVVIQSASEGFLFIALLMSLASFILGPDYLIDGAAYAVLGLLLWRFKSRIIAVLLVLLSLLEVLVTIGNMPGASGGTNIFLPLIVLWVSIRAFKAASKLHELKNKPTKPEESATTPPESPAPPDENSQPVQES